VTDELNPEVRRILQPRSKAPVFLILATIATVTLIFYTAFVASSGPNATPVGTAENHPATVEELDSVKRQMDESSQSMIERLNAQQNGMSEQKADLQKLADQVSALNNQLSALNEKIAGLQKTQAASEAHAEKQPEAQQAPQSTSQNRPRIVAARRRPVVPKPAASPVASPAPEFPTLVPQVVAPANSN
jgi:septal ring factor EnvC (AmiA/AmiB activator)